MAKTQNDFMAGKIHPLLRTLLLGRELLNKQQSCIEMANRRNHCLLRNLATLDDQQLVNYLRLNTYLTCKIGAG
ncbi:hypothetical protein ACT691_06765 [Vibrio metschnikovii]